MSKSKDFDVLAKAAYGYDSSVAVESTADYILHPSAKSNAKFRQLRKTLLVWLNRYMSQVGSVVQDLVEDLSDGQVLGQFLNQMTDEELSITPAISEKSKRANLVNVVNFITTRLGIESNDRWSVDGLLKKDISSAYCLMVDLAHNLRCPEALPSNVQIAVIHAEVLDGVRKNKTKLINLTEDESAYYTSDMLQNSAMMMSDSSLHEQALSGSGDIYGSNQNLSSDAFDALFDSGKADEIRKVTDLITVFLNSKLSPNGVTITDLKSDMHDGVFFIIVVGSLANFFVPFSKYTIKPTTPDQKLNNVMFAFKLMESLGMNGAKWNALDVVRQDLKMILRISYDLFKKFSTLR